MRIEFDQRVPMRDGITLSADIYFPTDPAREAQQWPVILSRTPYQKATIPILASGKYYAERGYVFVAMALNNQHYIHAEGQNYNRVVINSFNPAEENYYPRLDEIVWDVKRVIV